MLRTEIYKIFLPLREMGITKTKLKKGSEGDRKRDCKFNKKKS